VTESEQEESFEEMCTRLGFAHDTSSGSTVIFAGKRLAEKMQGMSAAAKTPVDTQRHRRPG
jgi:hypothetical protein